MLDEIFVDYRSMKYVILIKFEYLEESDSLKINRPEKYFTINKNHIHTGVVG